MGDGRRATGDGRRATGDGGRATGDGRRANITTVSTQFLARYWNIEGSSTDAESAMPTTGGNTLAPLVTSTYHELHGRTESTQETNGDTADAATGEESAVTGSSSDDG